jgi:hypothetical protein
MRQILFECDRLLSLGFRYLCSSRRHEYVVSDELLFAGKRREMEASMGSHPVDVEMGDGDDDHTGSQEQEMGDAPREKADSGVGEAQGER